MDGWNWARIPHLYRIVRRFFDKLEVFSRHIGMKRLASLLAVSAVLVLRKGVKNGEKGSTRFCGVASR